MKRATAQPKLKPILVVEKLCYDRKSAAFALSISMRRLDYLLATKQLRANRAGRSVLIPASELRRISKLAQMMAPEPLKASETPLA